MQLVRTCSSALASLSFVANHGHISPHNAEVYRYNGCIRNINADSVFQEAEELISELPRQASTTSPTPFSKIHDAIMPIDRQLLYNKQAGSGVKQSHASTLEENNIRKIIEKSFGVDDSDDDNKPVPSKPPQVQSKKKYGPGRPLSMKIWMNIGTNDLITRCKRARKFIEDGIPVMFKIEGQGATANYMTHAQVIVNTAMSVLSDVARLGGGLQQHVNFLSQIFNPIAKVKRPPNGNAADKRTQSIHSVDGSVEYKTKGHTERLPSTGIQNHGEQQQRNFPETMSGGVSSSKWMDTRLDVPSTESIGKAPKPFEDDYLDGYDVPPPSSHSAKDKGAYNEGALRDTYFHSTKDMLASNPLKGGKTVSDVEMDGDVVAPDGFLSKMRSPSSKITPTSPVMQSSSEEDRKESIPTSDSGSNGYWMDANEKSKGKETTSASSKFMTIEKSPAMQHTEGAPSTVKNDAMLKRFMAMRNGNLVPANGNPPPTLQPVVPANPVVIPAAPMLHPPPIGTPKVHPYEMASTQPYIAPYEAQPTYPQKFPWQHGSSMYREPPPTPYSHGQKWITAGGMGHASAPKPPAMGRPKSGPAKPESASKSRWLTLDKGKS